MFKELMNEWKQDPDPTWLKVLSIVAVVVFFTMMVML
jgi:hypothetical protein